VVKAGLRYRLNVRSQGEIRISRWDKAKVTINHNEEVAYVLSNKIKKIIDLEW